MYVKKDRILVWDHEQMTLSKENMKTFQGRHYKKLHHPITKEESSGWSFPFHPELIQLLSPLPRKQETYPLLPLPKSIYDRYAKYRYIESSDITNDESSDIMNDESSDIIYVRSIGTNTD